MRATNRQSQPSLSFEKQPALKNLITELVTGDGPITIFCGAGTSVDSGLPTWIGLVAQLAESIGEEDIRSLILREADIKRSAQFILDYGNSKLHKDHKIASALYRGESAAPGQLAASIANLCRLLGDRVRILTTNYDDRLELALIAELGGSAGLRVFGLSEAPDWLEYDAGIGILHVHGFIPSTQLSDAFESKKPVILTEGEYLRFGAQIQAIVHDRLINSKVIFIGTSMADSSVVHPLSKSYSEEPIKRPTALLVPDISSAASVAAGTTRGDGPRAETLALDYLAQFATYIRESLQTDVIELKSFGQVAQCVGEMSAAIESGDTYLSDDAKTSARYGHRFKRILSEVHERVAVESGTVAPSGDASRAISDRLESEFQAPDGPLSALTTYRLAIDYEGLNLPENYFEDEHWALDLWIRTMLLPPHTPRYEVVLVGSSSYSRRSGRAMVQRGVISPLSTYAAARSVFHGGVFTATDRTDEGPGGRISTLGWRTHLAAPLALDEASVGLTPTTAQRVTVGAVVLQSDRRLSKTPAKLESRSKNSILSVMDSIAETEITKSVLLAGLRAIGAIA